VRDGDERLGLLVDEQDVLAHDVVDPDVAGLLASQPERVRSCTFAPSSTSIADRSAWPFSAA
jgi:hypothetical protein